LGEERRAAVLTAAATAAAAAAAATATATAAVLSAATGGSTRCHGCLALRDGAREVGSSALG